MDSMHGALDPSQEFKKVKIDFLTVEISQTAI